MARQSAGSSCEPAELWDRGSYLKVPDFGMEVKQISAASRYLADAQVEHHPFFECAQRSLPALHLWAEQELVISSMFSQSLAAWIASIDNCHVRALVIPVLVGEHGTLRQFKAVGGHPVLAEALCKSLGSVLDRIPILEPTHTFLRGMAESTRDPMEAAGFLGIGSEKMLLPEYRSMMYCFERLAPESSYRQFLEANIEEDEGHHRIVEAAIRGLVSLGYEAGRFLSGASRGVDTRVEYLNQLVELYEIDHKLRGLISSTR